MDAVLAEVDAEPAFAEPTSQRFVAEIDQMVWHQDEPIVSTGPYAQWCVMRLAQPSVTVLLNGQGGDELLAGYVPYQYVYLRQLLKERKFGAFQREAWASRDVLQPLIKRRLADRRKSLPIKPLLRPALYDGLEPPKFQRSQDDMKKRLVVRSPDVLAAVAAALRGPQLDGVLDGVAPAVPRPGAGRLGAAAAAVGHRARRLEPRHPARRAEGRAHREGAHPPVEGGLHHARDPLVAGATRGRAGAVPLAAVLRPAVLGRRRPGRHLRAVLRRRGRAVADLLARDQHRALDARVLRPRRRLAARRRAGRALRSRRRRVARCAQRTRRGRTRAVLRARPAPPVRAFDRRRT